MIPHVGTELCVTFRITFGRSSLTCSPGLSRSRPSKELGNNLSTPVKGFQCGTWTSSLFQFGS